jgi:hypothetical protein
MPNDNGVWVKMGDAAPIGAAVINDAASNYDNKNAGVTIDGKTYDIYTFNTATTTRSMRLTDEALARITDEDLLMAVATTELPDDFTGDPVTLFNRKYSKQLRNAFDVTPAVDPGLSLTVGEAGFVDALLVAGGGGGGSNADASYAGGGGGAGAMHEFYNIYLSADAPHPVVVGQGGPGGTTGFGNGQNGGFSALGDTSIPGGGGGGSYVGYFVQGNPGGSGGGAGSGQNRGRDHSGFAALGDSFGHKGGDNRTDSSVATGGGGGAGSAGGNSPNGIGGSGRQTSFTGSPQTFAGGGGASMSTGTDGGGDGRMASNSYKGQPGTANTGGGGGGGYNNQAGNGGSGIVIVRVEI